jgi:cation transport ATPase
MVAARSLVVGSCRLMRDVGIVSGADSEAQLQALARQGKTTVSVAVDGTLVALIATADTIKACAPGQRDVRGSDPWVQPSARAVVRHLHRARIEVWMATGDNAAAAHAVAAQVRRRCTRVH